MEDLRQYGHCGEPEDRGIQGCVTVYVGHQCGVQGGLGERLNPLNDAVAVRPHGEVEGGASRTVHPNRYTSSAFVNAH